MGELIENGDGRHGTLDAMPNELPPVETPSGKEIVQLFLIPAVVVAVLVGGWLLVGLFFGKIAGGEQPAMDYVRTIQTGNSLQRYRAAYELASLIHNDARAGRDPRLLGELTELLTRELNDKQGDPKTERFLALAIGVFQILDARSSSGREVDPIAALCQALSGKYELEVRKAAAESLARQAARLHETFDDPRAVRALVEAGEESPPELRERAAFALAFFGGERAAAALRKRLKDEDHAVRYNVAAALARRGDPEAIDVLREMLNPVDLAHFARMETASATQNQMELIQLEALRSLQVSVSKGNRSLAILLRPEVVARSRSGLVSVRTEAAALLKNLPESR